MSRRRLYFIKMSVFEGARTWVDQCKGKEVHFFSYMLCTMNRDSMIWTNTRMTREVVTSRYGIGDSTQLEYLRRFIARGLVGRVCRGQYKINPDYASYGADK